MPALCSRKEVTNHLTLSLVAAVVRPQSKRRREASVGWGLDHSYSPGRGANPARTGLCSTYRSAVHRCGLENGQEKNRFCHRCPERCRWGVEVLSVAAVYPTKEHRQGVLTLGNHHQVHLAGQ